MMMIATRERADRLGALLSQGKKVLLMAPRRSGKSHLIQMIQDTIKVGVVVTTCKRARDALGADNVVTREELLDTEEGREGEVMIFDEPWVMEDTWKFAERDGGCLFIGTPTEGGEEVAGDHFDLEMSFCILAAPVA